MCDHVLDEVLDDVAILTIRIESASISVTHYETKEADTSLAESIFNELLSNVVRYESDAVEFALDISGSWPGCRRGSWSRSGPS
jgi:hypothetical protein